MKVVAAFHAHDSAWILPQKLESLAWCYRTVVVFDRATEEELRIASCFANVEVVHHSSEKYGFNSQGDTICDEGRMRQLAWDSASYHRPDWILLGDADEIISPDLERFLYDRADPEVDVYYLHWINLFKNDKQYISGGIWAPTDPRSNKKGVICRWRSDTQYLYPRALTHTRMEPNAVSPTRAVETPRHRLISEPVLVHYKFADWTRWKSTAQFSSQKYRSYWEGLRLSPTKPEWLHPARQRRNKVMFITAATRGSPYEAAAERLRRSLAMFGRSLEVVTYADQGSWVANCAQKPVILRDFVRHRAPRAAVWLDADAEVVQDPVWFDNVESPAAFAWVDRAIASGTIYLRNTLPVRALLAKWVAAQRARPNEWDQRTLAQALRRTRKLVHEDIPPTYIHILDRPSRVLPVITHSQMSRDKPHRGLTAEDVLMGLPRPIVLVGNGPIAPGTDIDSYASVVRFNNYRIRGFEALVGTRTDVWVTNGWSDVPDRPARIKVCPYLPTTDIHPDRVVPYGAYTPRYSWASAARARVRKPTTGTIVIEMLTALGIPYDLVGFTRDMSGGHYWAPTDQHDHPPQFQADRRATEAAQYASCYRSPTYGMGSERKKSATAILAEQPRGSYLDVATGRGEMLEVAESLGFAPVIGTEVVPELLGDRVVLGFLPGPLTFRDQQYSIVSCFDVLEHLLPEDTESAVRELARVTQRTLILAISNTSSPWEGRELHINRRPYPLWDRQLRNWLPNWDVVWREDLRNHVSETWVLRRQETR